VIGDAAVGGVRSDAAVERGADFKGDGPVGGIDVHGALGGISQGDGDGGVGGVGDVGFAFSEIPDDPRVDGTDTQIAVPLRIGGIEKADGIGTISYDPDNHDKMVRLRQAKIDAIARTIPDITVDDPSGAARVLILGWGSTFGPISAACRLVRTAEGEVAQAHIRHLNPFPSNLGEILKGYEKVIVPEMNLGQLALLLRAKYLVDIISYNQVRGMPFKSDELAGVITDVLESL
jgi:pyruvate/2-oxoacid:ferredoxin oxidoreductase alpha subunit